MRVRRPDIVDLSEASASLGLDLSGSALESYLPILDGVATEYDIVEAMTPEEPLVRYPRTTGRRPTPEDNPYNAWSVQSEIRGSENGSLKGLTVAIKDNICIAGLPMANGSSTLRGYVPDVDATLVTRLLDAGATILGKGQCEFFCVSGASHTSAQGPVENPRKPGHSTGGSSSGCSALVASGAVDIAIGTDQGGSVRIPAAYAGFHGMKPTHGLIPYSGVMPVEMTLDHAGIMTNSVAVNARTLEALAGPDGLDPRQVHLPELFDYTSSLAEGVKGLRIGVVREGFGWDNSEADVDEAVHTAAALLGKLGAEVKEIDLPLHRHGHAIWTPIAVEGTTNLLKGFNYGSNWKGLYVTSLMRAQRDWQANAGQFPPDLAMCLLAGHYFAERFHGQYYAKAQNLVRRLKGAYEAALKRYDLLLMPTVPMKASRLPPTDADPATFIARALEMNANTAPFNATGLPAMSVPCAMRDGLPVGMMLVGAEFSEARIYRAAAAFEAAHQWMDL